LVIGAGRGTNTLQFEFDNENEFEFKNDESQDIKARPWLARKNHALREAGALMRAR
jgi:hypothetical protein